MATRIDESFLRRNATSMESSMLTTSLATTTLARSCCHPARDWGKPTSNKAASGCWSRKRRQAGKVTTGP